MRVSTAVLPVMVLGALVTGASPAGASGPAGMATGGGDVPSLRVSPAWVVPGGTVRVTGHCEPNTYGYVLSNAFRRDASHEFADVAAVPITTDAGGDFSTEAQIPANRRPGAYPVGGRCGGGNLGISTTLVVTPAGVPTAVPAGSGGRAATGGPVSTNTRIGVFLAGFAALATAAAGLARRRRLPR
jgi:hypothetical protein